MNEIRKLISVISLLLLGPLALAVVTIMLCSFPQNYVLMSILFMNFTIQQTSQVM